MLKTIKQITFEEAVELTRDNKTVVYSIAGTSTKPTTKVFKNLTVADALAPDQIFYIVGEEVQRT